MVTLVKTRMDSKIICCTYGRLLVDKATLPIFISFKPNNHIQIKLKNTITSDKIEELLQGVMSKWFTDLRIVSTK